MSTNGPTASASSVLVVGPDPALLGGMAAVVRQMLELDYERRYRVEFLPVTASSRSGEPFLHRIVRHVRQLFSLRRFIRRKNVTIVHLHTCSGFAFYRSLMDLMVSRRANCRVVLHVHGAAFDEFHERAGLVGKWMIRRGLSAAHGVVALSEGWRRKLQAMSPAALITVVENAIEAPKQWVVREVGGLCRFLMLARMDEWKGVDDLLDACAILNGKRCRFELILAGPPGTAGDQTILNQKILARGLEEKVRYIGPVQGEEKRRVLDDAHVYVQPSRHEGMPLSMLEALAHGLPVVATSVGAVPEVIDHGHQGLLVAPARPGQLALAMAEITNDPTLRETLVRAGRKLIEERFGLARFRDDLLALYNGLSATSPRSHRVPLIHRYICSSPSAAAMSE